MPKTSKQIFVDDSLLHTEFRKKITSKYHLTQLQVLARKWGNIKVQDVCWRLIVDGIERERRIREGEKE